MNTNLDAYLDDIRDDGYREPIMDDEDALRSDIREHDERIMIWFERVFHILNAYQQHQRGERELRMSCRAMQFALGYTLAAGADSIEKLSRQCGMSKQAVTKAVNHFEAQLKLEPLPCQRAEDARLNMATARKKQVKS